MRIFAAVAIFSVSLSSSAIAQNCQFIGNQTYCDNGVNSQTIGNTT